MSSIIALCNARKSAEIEVRIFGRVPLAISARCYSARAHGLHKDGCRYVCGEALDGMDVETLDHIPFLAVNGLQTLSSHYLELSTAVDDLKDAGVTAFRISPHTLDMVRVANLYRRLIDGETSSDEVRQSLLEMQNDLAFADGFLHSLPGADLRETLGSRAE